MDIGLLLLRLLLGLLVAGHGAQKLFGWFGGGGIAGTAAFFDKLGFRPARVMATVAALTEVGAGLLVVLGLLTPLAAAGVIGTLLVAGGVNAAKGLWAINGGYELPLVYAGIGVVLALTGPGAFSVDRLLGIEWAPVASWGAVLLGLVAGVAVLFTRKKPAAS